MADAPVMSPYDVELSDRLEDQLSREIATLRDLAVRSRDPLVVAKAIAISHDGVQRSIRERFAAGERLAEVCSFEGDGRRESQVLFRFLPVDGIAGPSDTGILAVVDLVSEDVIGVVDPLVEEPGSRAGRPFVALTAPETPDPLVDDQAMKQLVGRERAFLEGLGLGHLLTRDRGGSAPSNNIMSVTYSPVGPGGRYIQDDTGAEACDEIL